MRSALLLLLLTLPGCAYFGPPSPRWGLCATDSECELPIDCASTADPFMCEVSR